MRSFSLLNSHLFRSAFVLVSVFFARSCLGNPVPFPFGESQFDTFTNLNDDNSSEVFNLAQPMMFLNSTVSTVYQNTNGHVTFDMPYPVFVPIEVPSDEVPALAAAYWTDIDTRNGGNETNQLWARTSNSVTDLQIATTIIEGADSTFVPENLFIATWYKVEAYEQRVGPQCSFQLVMAYDDGETWVIFSYEQLEFFSAGLNNITVIGFNDGAGIQGELINVVDNDTTMNNLVTQTNCGIAGTYAYRINQEIEFTTPMPNIAPSSPPSISSSPTYVPSMIPSSIPSAKPSTGPSLRPSVTQSAAPSSNPSLQPSVTQSATPSTDPSEVPSLSPSFQPSVAQSAAPSLNPSEVPSLRSAAPSSNPSPVPSLSPSLQPSVTQSNVPSVRPSRVPTSPPSSDPSSAPSVMPSHSPSLSPIVRPRPRPTRPPTAAPSTVPSRIPSFLPTAAPIPAPPRRARTRVTVNSPELVGESLISTFEETCGQFLSNLEDISSATCVVENQTLQTNSTVVLTVLVEAIAPELEVEMFAEIVIAALNDPDFLDQLPIVGAGLDDPVFRTVITLTIPGVRNGTLTPGGIAVLEQSCEEFLSARLGNPNIRCRVVPRTEANTGTRRNLQGGGLAPVVVDQIVTASGPSDVSQPATDEEFEAAATQAYNDDAEEFVQDVREEADSEGVLDFTEVEEVAVMPNDPLTAFLRNLIPILLLLIRAFAQQS